MHGTSMLVVIILIICLILVTIVQSRSVLRITLCSKFEITVVTVNDTLCLPCPICQRGREPKISCGSIVKIKGNNIPRQRCRLCRNGTYYSGTFSWFARCEKCTKCKPQEHEIQKCSPFSNTRCLSCSKGYYYNNETLSCLPCSQCCSDGFDRKVPACIQQGVPLHCSFDSHKRCHKVDLQTSIKPTPEILATKRSVMMTLKRIGHLDTNEHIPSHQNLKWVTIAPFTVVIVLLSAALITMIFLRRTKTPGNRFLCISKRSSSKYHSCTELTKSVQSDEVQDWAQNNHKSGTYTTKCGIYISYDKNSRFDGARNFAVEVAKLEQSCQAILDPDQFCISPAFVFYTQGTQFENPVQISLPHSALIDDSNKWDIKVLVCDTRQPKKVRKSKEFEGEVLVEWNQVKFSTRTLLSYMVVGKPVLSAKKRMQLVLFSMQEMVSDRLEMVLYLIDESISSLQRVVKENKAKGWAMISSKYAVFIECSRPVNISVAVNDLEQPWTLQHVQPEVISNKVLVDSYTNVPTFNLRFKRCNRSAQRFSCHVHVDIGENKIIIPAVTFLPEELPFFNSDVCNKDPTVFDKLYLLKDLSYDIKYQLSRKLDIPAKDRGQWRDVGRSLGVSEEVLLLCSREYATQDGSPSSALLDYLATTRPKLTVGEMAKLMEDLNRNDVVAVLSKIKTVDVAIG